MLHPTPGLQERCTVQPVNLVILGLLGPLLQRTRPHVRRRHRFNTCKGYIMAEEHLCTGAWGCPHLWPSA